MRSAIQDDQVKIPAKTFFEWIDKDENKRNQYARAMELRAELIFEEIMDIADDQVADVLINDKGEEIINHNVINRARLRVDARKWMLGKMNPKKYSDKIYSENKNEHSGEIKIIREIIK